jgi:hypothetical protein
MRIHPAPRSASADGARAGTSRRSAVRLWAAGAVTPRQAFLPLLLFEVGGAVDMPFSPMFSLGVGISLKGAANGPGLADSTLQAFCKHRASAAMSPCSA